uniref:Uncharacterized protein n=1 Tax=Coccidioides posadasii RMSCC 3488 TaxID=454284 RepID=A0A0J6FJF4_COCPO|nr:hypothetical protein CPAG_05850 [Coccidioides posadasii RMSCC 3488]
MAACSVRLQQAVLALQGALASWRAQKAGGAFPLKGPAPIRSPASIIAGRALYIRHSSLSSDRGRGRERQEYDCWSTISETLLGTGCPQTKSQIPGLPGGRSE